MSGNSNLHMSRSDKADEFYTQLSLIESELILISNQDIDNREKI